MENMLDTSFVDANSVFFQLGQEGLNTLLADARILHLEPHEHLFDFSQKATHFYLIKTGSLSLYKPNYSGEHKVFRVVTAGHTVAEAIMFIRDAYYPLSALALTKVVAYKIPQAKLLTQCQCTPEFSIKLLENMATIIIQSLNRIDLLTMGKSPQRIVGYLLELHEQQASMRINLPLPQSALARQLNIAPETFSRQIAQFRRSGYIGGRSSDIILNDINGLCASVGLPVPRYIN